MSDERLPRSARFVMGASRFFAWGVKAVWIELLALDRGPEGAWINDPSLAEVVGLDAGTVKNYRFLLRQLGLARTVARPGGRQVGWIMQLPPAATPGDAEKQVWGKRAVFLAGLLDAHLEAINRNPDIAPVATSALRSSQRGRGDRSASSARERGEGGSPPGSVVPTEGQLPAAVPSLETGVGAHAPRNQEGAPASWREVLDPGGRRRKAEGA